MNSGAISARYGKALLMFAQESGHGDRIYSQACVLVLRMMEVRQFREVMENCCEVPLSKKKALLDAALGEELVPELHDFLRLVASRKRMEYFVRMLYSFIRQYRQVNGIKIGRLVTAVPEEGLRERLEDIFQQKTGAKVHIEEKVDPAIMGGFVFEMDGYMVDASVAEQFRRIRRQLIEKNNRIV